MKKNFQSAKHFIERVTDAVKNFSPPGSFPSEILYSGGKNNSDFKAETYTFNLDTQNQTKKENMNTARCGHGLICIGRSVYAIGGWGNGDKRLTSCEKY